MGEYPRGEHASFTSNLANLTNTVNRLKTEQCRWIECFRTLDAIFAKFVHVQQLHMDSIWGCYTFAISDVGTAGKEFVEKQKRECKHLEEDISSLRKTVLERISGFETDYPLRPSSEESVFRAPEITHTDLRDEIKDEKFVELIDENGVEGKFDATVELENNPIIIDDDTDSATFSGKGADSSFSCESANGKRQLNSVLGRNGSYTMIFVDTNALVKSEIPVIGSENVEKDSNAATVIEGDSIEIEEDCDLWSSENKDDLTVVAYATSTHSIEDEESSTENEDEDMSDAEEQTEPYTKPSLELPKYKVPILADSSPRFRHGVYECATCGKCFTQRNSMIHHLRRHSAFLKRHECVFCAKRFEINRHLQLHTRKHYMKPSFQCDLCEKKFFENSELVSHTRIHTGEKPFKCKVCDKQFRESLYLSRHQKIHKEGGVHRCDICGKVFKLQAYLSRHLQRHAGVKRYKCMECDKRFTQSGHLTAHLRTHSGERPFSCEICAKRFTSSGSLRAHRRLHVREPQYQCSVCEQKFPFKKNLQIHIGTHSGKN